MQEPQIDDITFEQLVAEAKARIPVHNPEWTNYSEADPGITMLELFAFMTESLLYRANRIPERNRRKFLQLVGLEPRPATSAHGIVTFDSTKGVVSRIVVDEDTEVRAGSIPFRTVRSIDVLPVVPVVCAKTQSEQTLDEAERDQYLSMYEDYALDAEDVRFYETTRLDVPSGATTYRPIDMAATIDQSIWVALLAPKAEAVADVRDQLAGRTLTLGLLPDVENGTRVLYPSGAFRELEQRRLSVSIPKPEAFDELAPKTPKYVTLSSVEYGDVVVEPGTITVELPATAPELELWPNLDPLDAGFGDFPPLLDDSEADRLVTWLRLRRQSINSSDAAGDQLNLPVSWLGVNAVRVEQRSTVAAERIGRGTGAPDQQLRLGKTPVIPESVTVRVGSDDWTRTDDLGTAPSEISVGVGHRASRTETAVSGIPTVFTVDADGVLTFGSGLRGSRPPAGADIVVSYDYGGGHAGMVPAGAISTALGLPTGAKVTNAIPTWGGDDTEALEDAESRMSKQIRHRDRVVTAEDAYDIVKRTPGLDIGRVEILPLVHPELIGVEAPGVITVMVIPATDPIRPNAPRPDRMFLDAVCDHLEPRRIVTTEIHVRGANYVDINVSIGFEVAAGRDIPKVREAITKRVRDFTSPLANDDFPGWPLGKPIDPREFITEVARIEGVGLVNGVIVTVDGVALGDPHVLTGLQLPRLVGLTVQPGDPTPTVELEGVAGSDPQLLPIPAIPEDC